MPDADQRPSGAAMRARLAAYGRAHARGAAFAGTGAPFAALCTPPPWLSVSPAARAAIGALAALIGVGPALRGVIDGRVLGPLAEAFGDDALAFALERTEDGAGDGASDTVDADPAPEALRAEGARLVAAALAGDAGAVRLMNAATRLSGDAVQEPGDAAPEAEAAA